MNKSKKYASAGVNIAEGDAASKLAGKFAALTFAGRKGIGKPVKLTGGFAGILDFGKFYLVMGDDGVGTKMEVAEKMKKFDTLGSDLLAMVVDDAVCLGAEVVAMTNTLDTQKVNQKIVGGLLKGLAKVCRNEGVVIAGGELAEVGKAVNGMVWNATAIGIVDKKKVILGDKIKVGDAIIALKEDGLRSNGFSLARKILADKFGENYHRKFLGMKKWGELLLTPSRIYHSAILELVGRFGEKPKVAVKGICHITGGGIPGNLPRILPKGLGAKLTNLWKPAAWVKELIRIGKVSEDEAREVWNLGNGMLLVVNPKDIDKTLEILRKRKIPARIAGEITKGGKIVIE
ncbi:phosphoribosylformylglycinamidine cyclo-ligase [Candidatus Gracilibacteria bacterium]|nr:phosphoribosylformylglycinamidine cyclo-ligase [Candidatus Gracilibacteria bacterium]MCF7856490.1 phosphoribosylformylglycinamidine cyclo-ligase [Candidatus Gracilibacteria bacterium]MCF7896786.1 phosphoribosylformylglycinamidine cyclo-ligase [Candidatus Gracilibacteria bacterium]